MYELDPYLDELVSLLDCDPLRRDEIRLEVHSHLRELMQEQTRRGRTPEESARAAIARFGAAEAAARGLGVARRGRRPVAARVAVGRWVVAVTSVLAMPVVAIAGLAVLWRPIANPYRHPSPPSIAACVMSQLLCTLVIATVAWAISRKLRDALVVGVLTGVVQVVTLALMVAPAVALMWA